MNEKGTVAAARHGAAHVPDLAGILVASLSALAAAGEVDTGCRLARTGLRGREAHEQAAAHGFDVLHHHRGRDPGRCSEASIHFAAKVMERANASASDKTSRLTPVA